MFKLGIKSYSEDRFVSRMELKGGTTDAKNKM